MENNFARVDHIDLLIDYHIIEHFSNHLYSSPNKAIEELVINGYDAGASWVKIYMLSHFTDDKILMWDNGYSMDIQGIKNLWKVADSPKRAMVNRTVSLTDGSQRKIIGKFGIGKIASYTLGSFMSHLCKISDKFFLVTVNYDELMNSEEEGTQKTGHNESGEFSQERTHYTSPILELTKSQAKEYICKLFATQPKDFESNFDEAHWTLAIIHGLRESNIPIGRLRWILSNAMPIQPRFETFLNDEKIIPKLITDGLIEEIDFGHTDFKSTLQAKWKEGVAKGLVEGEVTFGNQEGLNDSLPTENVNFIELPHSKKIWGKGKLFNKSLLSSRSNEIGRSHGFFIYVLNRLVNLDDDAFLLGIDPSYGAYYSSQFVIHANEFDNILLADRERVKISSPQAAELRIVQIAIYSVILAKWHYHHKLKEASESYQYRLPINSAEYFLDPLAALWIKEGTNDKLGFDYKEPKIEPKALGAERFICEFSSTDGFIINSEHPYYKNITKITGSSSKSHKIVKEFEVIAVSEQIFQGYMYEIGISDEKVNLIMQWRDSMFRKIAKSDKTNLYQLEQNLFDASYKAGAAFEIAICDVLNTIGFNATRDGASGQKDGFVHAYCGDTSFRFTIEAKACSTGSLANDDAETGSANSHREKAKADHAVIIARKFAGFDRPKNEGVAILDECITMGTVSIMEVEALVKLMYTVYDYSYSLDAIKEVFMAIESPSEKLKRIEVLNKPFEFFDYYELLTHIREYQNETGEGQMVSSKHIWQTKYRKLGLKETDFNDRLEALRHIAYPLVQFDRQKEQIALRNTPDIISVAIQNRFTR